MRRPRQLSLVWALALVAAGCAEPAAEEAAPAISTPPVQTSGPLGDSFEIEPGSGLVGTVFPVASGDGWQAVLRVDGDAPRLFDGYVRQAEELGHRMVSGWCCGRERQWCSDPDDEITDDDPPGGFPVGCTAYTHPPDVQSLALSMRGFVETDGAGYVHIRADRIGTKATPLAPVADGPAAPATDVEVSPDLTPEGETPVRVVQGSVLVADPVPSACVTGGYVAVLQVTRELAPVLRAYERQFTGAGFGGEGLTGNDDVLRVSTSTAGGGELSAVAVPGEPSHVLLERCND